MLMPFGKWIGLDVKELPDDYLKWLLCHGDLRKKLRTAVLKEHRARMKARPVASTQDVMAECNFTTSKRGARYDLISSRCEGYGRGKKLDRKVFE